MIGDKTTGNSETSGSIYFGIKNYEKFSRSISDRIINIIFPRLSVNHYKVFKIHQNILMSCMSIIGLTLSNNEVRNLMQECVSNFIRSLVSSGDMVGVTAAQSVSQPITQAVLKSQHSTGKKQTGNSTSLLSLNRLKIHKNSYRVHLKNGQIPAITKSTPIDEYINEIRGKISYFREIIRNRKEASYLEIKNFFLNDEIEELKINYDNKDKIKELKNKSKVKITHKEAEEILDSMESEFNFNFGNPEDFPPVEDFFKTSDKIKTYRFMVNYELWMSNKCSNVTKDYLLFEHEELKIEDFITSSCGKCKYVTISSEEHYDQNKNLIYINHHQLDKNSKVFRFSFDSAKIKNSGVSYMKILMLLFEFKGVMIVIHPISKFCFDIVQGDNSETVIKDIMDKILNTKVKGISGLEHINDIRMEVSDLTKFQFYDQELDETHVFLSQRNLLYFPIEEFEKRVVSDSKPERFIKPNQDGLFKLVYKGKISIRPIPYYYFDYCGSIDFETIREKLGKIINMKYLISGNHNEMIENFGKIAARIAHESYYMDELNIAGSPLNYQNVSLICRRIFGFNMSPVTPSGLLNSGVNILEKLCFQNHPTSLTEEILTGPISSTDGVVNALFIGNKSDLGTNYVKFEVDQLQKMIVDQSLAEAKREQKYFAMHQDINLPDVGENSSLTNLKFVEDFFRNKFEE